jgi:hypothetical protein
MSGDAGELPGSASSPAERDKARRFLLGIPTLWLTMTLLFLSERVGVSGPLGLTVAILAVALMIGCLILTRSRPQGSERALTPRTLRRIARLAGVPELGAMIVVYGCLIGPISILTLSTVALFHA